MEVDGSEDDTERGSGLDQNQCDSDLERLNVAVRYLVQVLEEEVAIVRVEQLSKSLGVIAEVASRGEGGTEDTRDTALANETVKVLLSKCLGRGLTRERVRIIATLLPLSQNGEAGLTQVLDGLERPQTHVLPSGGIQLSQTLRETPSISLWLALLCSVGDSLFPSHPFLSSAQFWQIVQAGLKHEDPLPRKRALYLLRRATQSGAVFSTDLLCPESSSLPTVLNSYFLVLDTLEEKQPHLVRQLLPRLEELFSSCCAQVKAVHVIYETRLMQISSPGLSLHPSPRILAADRLRATLPPPERVAGQMGTRVLPPTSLEPTVPWLDTFPELFDLLVVGSAQPEQDILWWRRRRRCRCHVHRLRLFPRPERLEAHRAGRRQGLVQLFEQVLHSP